ncbi:MAG: 3-deoxy-D-manno-octulosonic acid kinase [Phycisphaerae bacterium]|nr:3-deoxy-D-manno-octulosonic acid kinase [Phycisphaerae bacterium]
MRWITSDQLKIDPAYRAELARCGLGTVDEILAHLGDRVAAWSRTTDSIYVRARDGRPGFYVKRYFYSRWRKRFRSFFRGVFFGEHRAANEFRLLRSMRDAGVPAVRPVACGARRVCHFVSACFLITEEVPDAENLTSFASRPRPESQRRAFGRALATHVAVMHAAGVVHGRLFWRNILVRFATHAEGDVDVEYFLLDARPPRRHSRAHGISAIRHELSRLAVSALPFTTRSERMRFLRHYARAARLTLDLHAEWRHIARRAERLAAHETQRIRMNTLFDQWNRALDSVNTSAAPT